MKRYTLRDPFTVKSTLLGVLLVLLYGVCSGLLMLGAAVLLVQVGNTPYGPYCMLSLPFLLLLLFGVVRKG